MSATTTKLFGQRKNHRRGKVLSVFALYDDSATREQVLAIGNRLAAKFGTEIKFKFHWWRTNFLTDPALGGSAAEDAAEADILVVACGQPEAFSFSLLNWFETWIERRHLPEGALLDLTETGTTASTTTRHTRYFFQDVAQRARMDYLTDTSQTMTGNPATRREIPLPTATMLSACMSQLQDQNSPPSHFGLNE